MSHDSNQARLMLSSIWQAQSDQMAELDEECNPNKVCRNMKEVTFEGFADEGKDLATAWRETLERDGKLKTGGSLGDLIASKSPTQ